MESVTETEQGEHAIMHSGQMAKQIEDAVPPWGDLPLKMFAQLR
jgi:hypothetical protein